MSNPLASHTLRQVHINWLLKAGVPPAEIVTPTPINLARGTRAADGIFEPEPDGPEWLAFDEGGDTVLWRPRTSELATEHGRAFALGQDEIRNPGATALGGWLHIHADPLQWLKAKRRGIVVIKWEWAFEQLRDVERISIGEEMVETYLQAMKPSLPELGVVPRQRPEVAA